MEQDPKAQNSRFSRRLVETTRDQHSSQTLYQAGARKRGLTIVNVPTLPRQLAAAPPTARGLREASCK